MKDASTEQMNQNGEIDVERGADDPSVESFKKQATLLTSLLNSIPDIVFFKNCDGVYLGCNLEFSKLVGRSRSEIIGLTDYDLFPSDVADFFRENDQKMMQSGEPRHNDEWITYPDGHSVLVDTFKAPMNDSNGTLLGTLGISRDITDKNQIQDELKKAKEQYQYIIDNTLDIIFQIDLKGNYIYANAAAEAITGYSLEALLGMNLNEIVAPEYLPLIRERLAERIKGGDGGRAYCFEIIHRKGHRLWVELETQGVYSSEGKLVAVQGVARDITNRKIAERALELRESYQSAILENLPGMVWLKDRGSRFLSVNQAFAEGCGVQSPKEMEGKTDFDFLPWELADRSRTDDLSVMMSERSKILEGTLSRDGKERWYETFRTPVFNASQEVIGTVGYAHDITPRKESEEKIKHLSNIQRELMYLATDFVNVPLERQDEAINQALSVIGSVIHADRSYLFSFDFESGTMSNTHEWCAERIEPAIEHLQNMPVDSFPGFVSSHRNGRAVNVPNVSELDDGSPLRKVLESQGIKTMILLPLMNGETCMGFVGFDAVQKLRNWQQEEIGLLKVMAEMFANFEVRRMVDQRLKKLNEELVQACQDAQAATRAKSMFLANMSHEIRTPLNAILGYSQILKRSCPYRKDNEMCKKGLGVLNDSGTHLLELINDILLLSRNEANRIDIRPQEFDFHSLLSEVSAMFKEHPDMENLSLDLLVDPDVPNLLLADDGKIRQVLINLLGNAVKFTTQGGIQLMVSLLADDEESLSICVKVNDSGVGIAEEDLEAIFSAFEQSAKGRESGKGSGLGLAISRQYARALGGDISATSTLGEGSCFAFSFSAQRGSHVPEVVDVRKVVGLADDEPRRRLLLIENDENSLEMLSLLLGSLGFEIETVDRGLKGLDVLLLDQDFDALLLDKKMPEMNGIETLKLIRQERVLDELPVIMMTASANPDDESVMMGLGANGFLQKPLCEGELLRELQRVVGIKYAYDSEKTRVTEDKEKTPLTMQQKVISLPDQFLESFRSALRRGHVQGLYEAIQSIEASEPKLSAFLKARVEQYDYEMLEKILTP